MLACPWSASIRLTEKQTAKCDALIDDRRKTNRRSGIKDLAPSDRSLEYDLMGSRGEYAAQLMTGLKQTGESCGEKKLDLLDKIEVKTTKLGGGLLVQQWQMKPLTPYLLVHAKHPQYWLVGWAFGFDIAKHPCNNPRVIKPRNDQPLPFLMPVKYVHSLQSLYNWAVSHGLIAI